jgi:uridine kinase
VRIRPLSELAATIEARRRTDRVLLVGIDGRGGSGKSTLARALARLVPAAVVIEFDDFYRPSATRLPPGDSDIGGNFEWRRLRDQVLLPLSEGVDASYQRYDWPTDAMAEWHAVSASGVVVIEGNYSTRSELRDLYGFRLWVQAPHEQRLARGLARAHAVDTRERWLNEWMPEEERYLEAEEPWRFADVVIDGSTRDGVSPDEAYAELSPADLATDDRRR